MSILRKFIDRLSDYSDREFFIDDSGSTTYPELGRELERARQELEASKIRSGEFVLLVGDFNVPCIAMLLALAERETVFAPLTVESERKLSSVLPLLKPNVRVEWNSGKNSGEGFRISRLRDERSLVTESLEVSGAGFVVFTSGSTGTPKAIVHHFLPLLEKFSKSRRAYRAIPFLLFDHMGGINTVLSVLSSGGCIVSTRVRTCSEVCRAIAKHRVTLLPTTPTFLNLLLLSEEYRNHDLSSLELITYGTEVMSEVVLRRLVEVFPKVSFKQTYGMSEFGVIGSVSKEKGSTWLKVGGDGIESKVVDGILWIKAKSQMCGYFSFSDGAPSWNLAKDDWFCTGDMVEEEGEYLRFLGRQCDIINVSGLKVYPMEVEECLLENSLVNDVAVRGVPHLLTGKVIEARIVLAVPSAPDEARKTLTKHCWERLERYKVPTKFVFVEQLEISDRFKKRR